jgi:hypothetical protein
MSYRNTFLGATDPQAYTAIRSTVAGTSEYISGMKAGQQDLSVSTSVDNTADSTFGMGLPK